MRLTSYTESSENVVLSTLKISANVNLGVYSCKESTQLCSAELQIKGQPEFKPRCYSNSEKIEAPAAIL